ncbi:uroporphyrinogen-III synthase [Bacillus pumilus]|uniref:uroporphyrinogen-III synthase n=1 Tax=Bacillus pumilus TaxID=1408 RepID=UPI00209F7737|nr:uroporphyrinogen-III synthase [Bacillus pumilus]MCP1529914.1 uroporphyrinogen-III synthase [Bacillus pumilus]MDF9785303.1 uroporphyrinogen-III synthase [Bacillus pumilus]
MSKGLAGKTIAICGTRKTEEMRTLVEKQGGQAVIRSLQGTVFLAKEELKPGIETFVKKGADWVILTTGVGTDTLIESAEELHLGEEFMHILSNAQIASRGYKTYAALKKRGIQPDVSDEDGTVSDLISKLEGKEFQGKRVMVQLHGENAPALMKFLHDKGADVLPLLPYQHTPPEPEAAETLLQEMKDGKVQAVCFTTAVQVHAFFTLAAKWGRKEELQALFEQQVLAVAVGKVTAEALKEEGIDRILAPSLERMGAMIMELSQYMKKQSLHS